jgi:hypothetical protein
MTTMYHGARRSSLNPTAEFVPRAGLCLTDDIIAAQSYAGSTGRVYEVEVDVTGAVPVDGIIDRDNQEFAGDDGVSEHEIIRYDDEDMECRQHDTWRLMTSGALARIHSVTEIEDEDDFDAA